MRISTALLKKIFIKYLTPELYKDENFVIVKYVDGVPVFGYKKNKK